LPVEDIGLDVIQAPKPEPRIMRYELTDFEWAAIVDPRVPETMQRPLRCSAEPGAQQARRSRHREKHGDKVRERSAAFAEKRPPRF